MVGGSSPNGICPGDPLRAKDKLLHLEVSGSQGHMEPISTGQTQDSSHHVVGQSGGPQLHSLGFLICELDSLSLPCRPLNRNLRRVVLLHCDEIREDYHHQQQQH